MPEDPNDVESGATMLRSSIMLPAWMDGRIEADAKRTFSSKAQVIRRLISKAYECEDAIEAAS